MKSIASAVTAAAILSGLSFTAVRAQSHTHVIQAIEEAQWGPAPPFLPAGAQIAVLAGDPTKATAYAVRLKFPANYAIPAHSHPTDENVVVVSGALTFGMGDKLAKKAAANKTLGVGGFALMPANMNHFGGFSRAVIGIAGRNLHTWTKYPGLDPEAFFLGGTRGGGFSLFDQTTNPQATQWVVSLNLGW